MSMIKHIPGKVVEVQSSKEDMVICNKCGKKYPKFWKRCPYCEEDKDKNKKVN